MSLLLTLRRAGQAADAAFQAEAPVSRAQYAVLDALDHTPGDKINQTTLVRASGVDRSTLSSVIKDLVHSGYVSRRRSRSDARAYDVRVTSEGLRILGQCRHIAANVDKLLVRHGGIDTPMILHRLMMLGNSLPAHGAKAIKPRPAKPVHQADLFAGTGNMLVLKGDDHDIAP